MLPGKVYKPEDVLRILRKRIWVVLVPWAIVAATTAGVARKLPDIYQSTALIQVTPPQVPDNIVRATTTVRLEDRLSAIQQTILSRTKLEAIIQELNLYEKERKTQIMQDVVENMRDDIHVQTSKGDAFTVRYQGRNPTQVMQVTEKLASLFKTQSMKEGEDRAQGTTSFVESQAEEAKRKLLDTEERLKKYRLAHSGELPSQAPANMAAISSIQMQLQSLAQSINSDQTARQFLERQIADLENQNEPASVAVPVAGETGTAAQNLVAAKSGLAALQARGVRPDHPDYKAAQRLIRDLTQQVEAESLNKPVGAGGGLSREEQARQKRLADLREQLEQVKKQIDAKTADEKKLRANAAIYQGRVDMVPVRDAELVELNRDYATYSQIYNDLMAKKAASSMAVDLATRQIGEQFMLIDAARLPQRPSSPNRVVINLGGIFGGLALGLALVALLEYRDTTFKTDTELARVLALPVLAVVPLMKSDAERRADFRKQLFLNVGLASTVFLCLAVLTYSFVFVK
jgi:polysaccharide chain length determinant protein (PEP-CTERM system associated)